MATQRSILWDKINLTEVFLKNNSRNVTTDGHGIFVYSDQKDVYADLRLCKRRAFWGHSHPLSSQELPSIPFTSEKERLNLDNFFFYEQKNFQLIEKHFTHPLKTLEFNQILESDLGENKFFRINITENILKMEKEEIRESFSLILKLTEKGHIWIHEDNLQLLSQDNFFFTPIEIHKKVDFLTIETSATNLFFSSSPYRLEQCCEESSFYAHLFSNTRSILARRIGGKLLFNDKIIDSFISSGPQLKLRREQSYIFSRIPKRFIENFFQAGVLIDDLNVDQNGDIFFCIPTACTKRELLDTLNLIKSVIEKLEI